MTDTNLISFNYIHTTKDELEGQEASFNEAKFIDMLRAADETQLEVQSIVVEISKNSGHSNDQYNCLIVVRGPVINITFEQQGNDAAAVTRDSIHKVITQIRAEKEKHTH